MKVPPDGAGDLPRSLPSLPAPPDGANGALAFPRQPVPPRLAARAIPTRSRCFGPVFMAGKC